jgi:diguanylate cyclase (GGDEF)-like protein
MLVGLIPGVVSQLTLLYIAARNRKAKHLVALDRLGRALSVGLSTDEVFDSTSEHLRKVAGVQFAFVHLDESDRLLIDTDVADTKARGYALELVHRARASRQLIRVDDAVSRSWLVLPLPGQSGCLGIVGQAPRVFRRDDLEFFGLVAERVSLALEAARRAHELVRMAYHDTLTGLPNRALLLDRLEQILVRPHADGRRAAVLLLDLDNFKLINDSLGHHAGDELLIAVSRALSSTVRPGDTVARLGGDEFVVLLPETPCAGSAGVAERIRSSIESALLATRETRVTATVSIGVACYPVHGADLETVMDKADQAMYASKSAGKNRTTVFGAETEKEKEEEKN